MGVDLRKDDGDERSPARGDVDRMPDRSLAGASAADVAPARWLDLPAPIVAFISAAWPSVWILMFIFGFWQAGLVMLFLTGPVMALLHGKHRGGHRPSRRQRRLERHQRRHELSMAYYRDRALARGDRAVSDRDPKGPTPLAGPAPTTGRAAPPGPGTGGGSASAAERSLAATLVRAETSSGRLDPEAIALVREVDVLLRPLLARVRSSSADPRVADPRVADPQVADPQVRRDLDTIATEHLPAALEAYLLLPADYAREHRTVSGTTPTDELRSQLTLLVEGCRQLRDAVHDADLNRQQELSRFLEAKFRRSDLDL